MSFPDLKSCTQEEFKKFITDYPNQLERHACTIIDPLQIHYMDWKVASKWPEAIIASYTPKQQGYCPESNWRIKDESLAQAKR